MKTKKLGRFILLALVAVVTMLVGRLVYKNKVIAAQQSTISELEYTHNLIQSIELRTQQILQLREQNKEDCQILAETGDVPQKLEWVCG